MTKAKPAEHLITKKIFQSYTTDELPPEIEENIKKLKKLNPEWEYKLFNDVTQEEYIQKNYGQGMLDTYLRIRPEYGAARSDFFRYLLIYKEGGVWLDIKSTLTKPLEEVLQPKDEFILSHWGKGKKNWGKHPEFKFHKGSNIREYLQFIIIAKPKHPFLDAVIQQVIKNIAGYNLVEFGTGKHGTLKLTGPIVYTLTIDKIRARYKYRTVVSNDFGIEYSIYKKGAHTKLFKQHYAKQETPIVK
jgi:mannosyltransferase OCH1-like enzyme